MYRPVNGGAERHVTIEGHGKRSCFLSGLRPKTTYQLRVKASSAHEDGPVSPSINVTTLDSGRTSLLLVEIFVFFPSALSSP